MSFEWILKNWFPGLIVFTGQNGIPSAIWAYMVALGVISYAVIKVSFGYFSKSRLNDLIDLYESYLKENETDLLVYYIKKYHIIDIKKYLKCKSYPDDEANKRLTKTKRILFASQVYEYILQDEDFVQNTANQYPELFAKAFKGMERPEASSRDLVKLYIQCLFEAKNKSFVRELQLMNGVKAFSICEKDKASFPILLSLFAHPKAAARNEIWYPVGEGAKASLKHDKQQKDFLIKKYDHYLKEELWNQKIYIAIVYFNYMVRETIYRDSGWHMWLYNFRNFTDLLIELIPIQNDYDGAPEDTPSFAHYVIHQQFSIMIDWLDLSQEQDADHRVIDTVKCLGSCVYSICHADSQRISEIFRRKQFDRILDIYFKFSDYPDNTTASTVRERLEYLFLNPTNIGFGTPTTDSVYLETLEAAWKKFDKVPYQYQEENGSIDRFETKVLRPLNLIC